MSFNDLERGMPLQSPSNPSHDDSAAFDKIKDSLSIQIFKINANVKGIEKAVERLNGGGGGAGVGAGGRNPREALADLLDSTRHLVQTSTPLLKTLLSHPIPPNTPHSAQRKTLQQKLSREYQSSLTAFQKIQRVAAEKQRIFVESQKREVRVERAEEEQREHQLVELEEQGLLSHQEQVQAQAQINQIPAHELEFQETQIAEREVEIREIESGIHELNEIFRDLGALVVEQGGMLDNIESNITSVATHTTSAAEELTTAHEYQRKAGRRMIWLMLILLVVVGIVLLAILS